MVSTSAWNLWDHDYLPIGLVWSNVPMVHRTFSDNVNVIVTIGTFPSTWFGEETLRTLLEQEKCKIQHGHISNIIVSFLKDFGLVSMQDLFKTLSEEMIWISFFPVFVFSACMGWSQHTTTFWFMSPWTYSEPSWTLMYASNERITCCALKC